MTIQSNPPSFSIDRRNHVIRCEGAWVVEAETGLNFKALERLGKQKRAWTINGAAIESLDTSGALFLFQLIERLTTLGHTSTLDEFSDEKLALFNLIERKATDLSLPPPAERMPFLMRVGMKVEQQLKFLLEFLSFIGEICLVFLQSLLNPRRLRWRALFSTVESAGYRAIFIIGLLSFLIGMVLVYQMGLQLRSYGASFFVTDILGASLLREFSPLITAIIVAGRTGSAFTAQIGTMKVNEEIDAIRTFGLSPTELLLLPRMLGLIIVLPLLTIVSELFGLMGGMYVSQSMLGISYADFIKRFHEVITLKTYMLGLIKVPVFAAIIAIVGCFQGLKVAGSAESVGQRTTLSVVHSIFLIIVADALISILYSRYGL